MGLKEIFMRMRKSFNEWLIENKSQYNGREEEDFTEDYDAMLDEGKPVEIGSLSYCPSTVLKAVDPIAYNVGLSDYVGTLDGNEWEEVNGVYLTKKDYDEAFDAWDNENDKSFLDEHAEDERMRREENLK